MEISKLEGIKRKAQKEGWSKFIRTPVDEKALLEGYTFSYDHFDLFRDFAEGFIKLTKGQWKGQPMKLLQWHEEVCGSLFGWIGEDGLRRFRRGYIEVPKKNSKTTLFSVIGLYMLVGDGEGSPEIYTCANEKEQAGILWNMAASAVETSPELSEMITVIHSTKRLKVDANSFFTAWSSDKSGKDGQDAHCVLVDELHEWKGDEAKEFWGKIRYAGLARAQPLCPLAITTAGDDKFSLCYQQRESAQKVLNGISEDKELFAYIRCANPEKIKADPNYWKTPECWKEANPAYGEILNEKDFYADVEAVENDPPEKERFLRYRLGVWTDAFSTWLGAGVWEKNTGPIIITKENKEEYENALAGKLAYLGMDLSSVEDLTALTYVFPYLAGDIRRYRTLFRVFCPEETLAQRIKATDAVSFRTWIADGFITPTPGSSIDHDFIFSQIEKDAAKFQIQQAAYDRYSAAWIIQEIQKKIPTIELFPFNQSMVGMSEPTKGLKGSLMKGFVEHGNSPLGGWSASNCVAEKDAQGNERLHKGRSKDKIDPIISLIMAHNLASLGTLEVIKKFSPYSNEGFEAIKKLEGMQEQKKEAQK